MRHATSQHTPRLDGVEAVDHHEPINILIVDDEPKNLTVLETILEDPGYRLVRADSAEEALLALVVEEFALLILDIRMPGMTGFELAQLIKERKKTARVPIILSHRLLQRRPARARRLRHWGGGLPPQTGQPGHPALKGRDLCRAASQGSRALDGQPCPPYRSQRTAPRRGATARTERNPRSARDRAHRSATRERGETGARATGGTRRSVGF